MKCAVCGRKFPAVIRPDKIPAGVGFVGKDGRTVDVCADCIQRAAYDDMVIEKVKGLLEGKGG